MSLLRKKSWWKIFWYSRFNLVLLLVLIAALYGPVHARLVAERDAAARREAEEQELAQAEAKRQELAVKVNDLKDDSGAEREIRRRFDVAKEGETVVVLLEEENTQSTSVGMENTAALEPLTWWQRLFSWWPF